MKFEEALKYLREGIAIYRECSSEYNLQFRDIVKQTYCLEIEDVLADDWTFDGYVPDPIQRAVQEISHNHSKIIDDWCKAYLAQRYQEGHEIKPGSFTLCEQQPTYHKGQDCMARKYWFEPGVPEFPQQQHWSETEEGRQSLLDIVNEKYRFNADGSIIERHQKDV